MVKSDFSRICLTIIFNHRYDNNILKLKTIYSKQFKNMIFLVPFYQGNDPDIIPVYESSYQFPGFLIQAYDKMIKNQAEYFAFIADDLILSPYINENNILNMLKIENKSIFITDIAQLNSKGMFSWAHSRFSSNPFMKKHQTQWKESIPDYQEALKKFHDFFGEKYPEVYKNDFFYGNLSKSDSRMQNKEIKKFIQLNGGDLKIPYPMAMGYSDIFLIKREALLPIARLCGVFSAMNMFAEIALPTAIVLTIDRKDIIFLKDTGFVSYIEWDEKRGKLEEEFQYNFSLLHEKWNKEILYMHPVKLSKWEI